MTTTWENEEGDEVLLNTLSTGHLLNIYRMLARNGFKLERMVGGLGWCEESPWCDTYSEDVRGIGDEIQAILRRRHPRERFLGGYSENKSNGH